MGNRKNRLIVSYDDGWIMSNMTAPVTPETIAEMMVATYPGSPIDGVSWCVGNSETFEFETQVGERTEDCYDHFESSTELWMHRNLYSLVDYCGGPLTEINHLFTEAGIDVFPSMRMDSHYDIAYSSPRHGKFRREHPEWLIGQPYEEIPFPTMERAIARGVDYKFPGVREYILNIVNELIERFHIAGVELDYFRHPAFFRIEEAYANRYLMTDFVRQVRRRLDEAGKERGKHLDLLVRMPPSPYDSKRIGLDIEVWIKEGLVDIAAAAKEKNTLESCSLSLGFDDIAEDEILEMRLNCHSVTPESVSHDGWSHTIFDGNVYHTTISRQIVEGTLIHFDVTDASIRKGNNELIVRFIKGNSHHFKHAVLKEVRLNIHYR